MRPRYRFLRSQFIYWVFLLFLLVAIGISILSFWYTPPIGPCSKPLDISCIPEIPFNATCPGPLEDNCIPNTLNVDTITTANIVITNYSLIEGNTKLLGDVICSNPIWPSCLDISGQSCMTPVQQSCIPTTIANVNVSNDLTVNNVICVKPLEDNCIPTTPSSKINCDVSLGQDCIPKDLILDSAVIQNLTAFDFTHVNVEDVNVTIINVDTITTNNIIVNKTFTCNPPAQINESCIPIVPSSKISCDIPINSTCVDISGKTCTTPVDVDCIPVIPLSKLMCDVELNSTCVDISNENCPNGALNSDCIPPDSVTCTTPIPSNCVDISGETCTSPLNLNCIPNIPTSQLICDIKLPPTCVNISGHGMCGSAIDQTCIPDIPTSKLICDIKLENDCITDDLVLNSLVVQNLTAFDFTYVNMMEVNRTHVSIDVLTVNSSTTKDLIITNSLMCIPPTTIDSDCVPDIPLSKLICDVKLDNNCIDISGAGVCSSKIDNSCYNEYTYEDWKNSFNLFFMNNTAVDISDTQITLSNTVINGPVVCTPPGLIDDSCIDISGETCSSPVDQTCIPTIPTSKITCDVKLDESCLDISMATCTNPINANCIDISGETCTSPINANCVDISGETCTSPVDSSCIPNVPKDVQETAANNGVNMNSVGYVDMPGMSLVTSNPSTGTYLVFFNAQLIQTAGNANLFFIINVNGVDIPLTERRIRLQGNKPDAVGTQILQVNIMNGVTIKIRWRKTGGGVATVNGRSLIIQQI